MIEDAALALEDIGGALDDVVSQLDEAVVALSDEGNLVIRCESFAGQMAVVPRSSNELEVAVVGRDALKSARA